MKMLKIFSTVWFWPLLLFIGGFLLAIVIPYEKAAMFKLSFFLGIWYLLTIVIGKLSIKKYRKMYIMPTILIVSTILLFYFLSAGTLTIINSANFIINYNFRYRNVIEEDTQAMLECKADGDQWRATFSLGGPFGYCHTVYNDGGNFCIQHSDCMGSCIFERNVTDTDSSGYLLGQCELDSSPRWCWLSADLPIKPADTELFWTCT